MISPLLPSPAEENTSLACSRAAAAAYLSKETRTSRIVELLKQGDKGVQVAEFHCVCEIEYYGSNYGLTGGHDDDPEEEERAAAARSPFAGSVVRFTVPVEVGEGMNVKEKGEFKLEVLRRVKESYADADAASTTICSDVLWGALPPLSNEEEEVACWAEPDFGLII